MTQTESAMAALLKTFDTYADLDGKGETGRLSKSELKTLLEREMPGQLKAAKNPEDVDKFLERLDLNGDSVVDFQEFVVLLTTLTCLCNGR